MNKNFEKYKKMSPFEIKNELIDIANKSCEIKIKKGEKVRVLNAGRGNPNFLNTLVRKSFSYLILFASELANSFKEEDLGNRPEKNKIYEKLNEFLEKKKDHIEVQFLKKAIDYSIEKFNFSPDDFVFTMVDAALGDFYPSPPRIFPLMEKILKRYLFQILGLNNDFREEMFDLFATEGAAAAMVYLFKSLKINKIFEKKDKVAIITPIFSPYLEMPTLSGFDLVEVLLQSKEELHWQVPIKELEKLKDPNIKAVYLVNPANPTSVVMSDDIMKTVVEFVKNERKDLIIFTDTVYATFVEKFHSLVKELPENVVCIYSFSKYFGVTGWRLGLIMLHKNNIIDKLIKKLPEKEKKELDKRYGMVAANPREVIFIERLELDSRDEALAHTGGLSGPQQSIMTLFALYELMDEKKEYKKKIHEKLKKRINDFYNNLKIPIPEEKGNTYYYSLIDLRKIAKIKYSKDFADYLEKNIDPLEFLFKLAEEKLTILLPGKGFAGPKWSMRISLANLPDECYKEIGKNVSNLLDIFYQKYKKQ
ncbi:MAG: hypothetical protein AMS24_00195 [Chlamydiae bacterium SM23_39]|nr:MAG: hypothetical protein AMS24_00195 [Chlamydiae bacterium SM23_39]